MSRRLLLILWPSFVMAGLIEMLVFSAAHPEDLKGFGGVLSEMSAAGVYTLAFFSFWTICALGSALTMMLSTPAPEPPDDGPSKPG
jgi:hypothetical protein